MKTFVIGLLASFCLMQPVCVANADDEGFHPSSPSSVIS